MSAEKCSLARAVQELKDLLADGAGGRDTEWTRRMNRSLATIEQSARRHRAKLEDDGGRVVDVDTSLNPSPTVARRTDVLRRELDELMQEARSLRDKARTLHPVPEQPNPATAAGALAVAPEAADVADFGVFCERVEQLLEGFEHLDEEEAELIQESVTLDLGAGD